MLILGAKVTVSSNVYEVLPGTNPQQEYNLDNAENVILIDDLQALHAGVQALQGYFSLPLDSWIVNKGKKTSIDSATVARDFLEVLRSIMFVEQEVKLTPGDVLEFGLIVCRL